MNAQVREAGESDYESLCALFAEENRFHATLVPEYIRVTPHVLTQEDLHDFLTSCTNRLFVYENGGDLLGAIIVSVRDNPQDRWLQARRIGYIEDLIVTTAAQGQGIGKQLMRAARDWVLSQDIQTVELCVWEVNDGARRFYESLGLECVQRRMVWRL